MALILLPEGRGVLLNMRGDLEFLLRGVGDLLVGRSHLPWIIFRMFQCWGPHKSVTFLTVDFTFQCIKISKEKELAFNFSP